MQGPAELLPVSSSGHLVLVPALLGQPYTGLDADVRKTFEVALHAGAGVALAWLRRQEAEANLRDPRGTALLAAPAVLVAFAAEGWIEQRASDPRVSAVAQIVSGAALMLADAFVPGARRREADTPVLLVIGLAQAAALVPGVSRNGATLTAARALGFDRAGAVRLSWRAGLPVIGGAALLKSARVAQRGLARELRPAFAAGAIAAFVSTLVGAPLARLTLRAWAPLAAYRIGLGALALRRLHRLQWPRG
jgi:undecaprenyl-diphosphatase